MGIEPADTRAVLVVDDEPASVELLRITLSDDYPIHTATSGQRALELLERHPEIAVAIIDQRMPGMTGTELIQRTIDPFPHLIRIILTGYTDIDALIQAINAGRVFRYLTKPWSMEELLATVRQGLEVHRLAIDNVRLQEELRAANQRLRQENTQLRRDARGRYRFDEIIGASAALQRLLAQLERVVPSEATVLILGETGTGKELVARALHYNGPRAERPFVSENCAAMAPELLTSELFGHRRGAFTGAHEDRQGLFEVANGGTLFLDEIGDCPAELQTRLLRVLDQGEIRRVGDNRSIPVDVRIIAATHRDLEADVAAGRFRRDLYYRLSVISLRTPPLRERREDIPQLAQHFLAELCLQRGKASPGFSAETVAILAAHDWPGNVRELRNEVERAFTFAEPEALIAPDLLSERFASVQPLESTNGTLRPAVERLERELIQAALARNAGNHTHTAAELGLSRRGLLDKLQRYGLR
ncbi:sigma-54-dependent Fis family transcriptional regulator [bacterium]|nr:sigma-54-dependent Fis family transcriptional regulator [bacterium]